MVYYNAEHLAELEAAAWKDDRHFRLASLDRGAFSYTDLLLHTPSRPLKSGGTPSEAHVHTNDGRNFSITGAVRGTGMPMWTHCL